MTRAALVLSIVALALSAYAVTHKPHAASGSHNTCGIANGDYSGKNGYFLTCTGDGAPSEYDGCTPTGRYNGVMAWQCLRRAKL